MAQAATPFTRQDAKRDCLAYQRLAGIVDRRLHRDIQRLDEKTAWKFFKSSVFVTIHSLHGFLNGREASHDKPVMKAHKFVVNAAERSATKGSLGSGARCGARVK